MELSIAVKHILDGNAIIIMGAGASYGAKNPFGDFPSGSHLAKDLYDLCNVNNPEDQNDLQDASQCYLEQHSSLQLISEIRTRLTCASFTQNQATVYSLPWIRYYTTNYDDVALFSAKSNGKDITPITLGMNFQSYHNYPNLCIHINGHIGHLNENTLEKEFKLTVNSYQSEENILNSQWGELLTSDLEAASSIVIVGLSLKYDLDLSRIIFNSETKAKTIIIDSAGLSPDSERKLARFGTVYKIGIDGFAEEIERTKLIYTPINREPVDKMYTCFTYDYHKSKSTYAATPAEFYNLLLNGQYSVSLLHKTKEKYDGIVYRSQYKDIKEAVLSGKKYIFIHSDLGNGKTTCLFELLSQLSNQDIHIFSYNGSPTTKLDSEILSICSINEKTLVIIEDYFDCMEVLRDFALHNNGNMQFVFTARSAINYNKMPDVFKIFSIKENESSIFDINKLNNEDLECCVNLFDLYGVFGRNMGLGKNEKVKLLRNRKNGNSRFQSILIDIAKSGMMEEKIKTVIAVIKNKSSTYISAIILVLLTQILKLHITVTDIERITKQDISTDALFRSNTAIRELLNFDDKSKSFIIKSPVTANLILHEITNPETIIAALVSLAEYATKYSQTYKYSKILINIVSYSHINSFFKTFKASNILSSFYDSLSKIDYYHYNNFFWLQYAISCIDIGDYLRAQKYLDDAYGLISDGFVPFQINNQQARLYLEKIINEKSQNVLDDYQKAHSILMLPVVSEKDNELNIIRLFGYYGRKDFVKQMTTQKESDYHKQACKDAFNRLTKYTAKHPEHRYELNSIGWNLVKYSVT